MTCVAQKDSKLVMKQTPIHDVQFNSVRNTAADTPDDDILDLGALVGTLWRGKWIIALATAIAILLGAYYTFVASVPAYRSSAVVMLETKQESVVDLQSVVGGLAGDTTEVNSELEVLKSRGLMGKVVDTLDLTSDPEFNKALHPTSTIGAVKQGVASLFRGQDATDSTPPELAAQQTRDDVISALLSQVSVRNVPQSLVFEITVETENARKSALIADTIVELYILNQIEVKFDATEQATTWLTERVAELQIELETSEAKVTEFNSSTALVSPEALQLQEVQLKDLRERKGSADPPPQVNPGPYTIGIGDVLVLSTPSTQGTAGELSGLLAAQNSRNGYTVQDDGSINIPDVGRVRLVGLTVDEAEALLFQRLVENQIDPTFSLEIAEFNSRRVSVGGAVGQPGVQPITLTQLTLNEALSAAGSVSVSDIDNSSVRIYRDGRMYQIPMEDLYTRTDLQNLNLIADDSVFVDTDYDLDRAERYFAQQIQLRETVLEGRKTALQELSTAVNLRRDDLDERRDNFIQSIELDAVDRDYVYLSGEVRTQGRYALPFGHTATLADALFDTGGGIAKETGDASEVYVLRASQDAREFGAVTAWHLDIRNAAQLTMAAQFELRNNDIIFIAENPVTRWGRTISQITPSLITTPLVAAIN